VTKAGPASGRPGQTDAQAVISISSGPPAYVDGYPPGAGTSH
jgi:hypothetical protein